MEDEEIHIVISDDEEVYQLTLIYHNGEIIMRGLDITDEGFSLTDEEGGGEYVPVTEGDLELSNDHG